MSFNWRKKSDGTIRAKRGDWEFVVRDGENGACWDAFFRGSNLTGGAGPNLREVKRDAVEWACAVCAAPLPY